MDSYKAAHAELKTFFADADLPDEEGKRLCIATIDGFHELFHQLVKELGIRDEWPEQLCEILPLCIGTVERSGKMGVQFTMAIGAESWRIGAHLRSSEHLRHMTDKFWGHIVKLASLGKVSCPAACAPTKTPEAKKLAQHQISLVFSLARDYVLIEQEPKDPGSLSCHSVGGIEVELPLDADEAKVRQFFKDGLESRYRANCLLYRSAYLESKRLLKQQGIKEPQLSAYLKNLARC